MNLTNAALDLEELESEDVPFPSDVRPSPSFLRITSDWYNTLRSKRTMLDGTRETVSVRAVDEVALNQIALRVIDTKRPDLPAKLDAMRMVDHLTMYGPGARRKVILAALAAAMSVSKSVAKRDREYSDRQLRRQRKAVKVWTDETAIATAEAMTTGKVGRSQRVVLLSIVQWYVASDRPLPAIVRKAVANALGLLDAHGDWIGAVREASQFATDGTVLRPVEDADAYQKLVDAQIHAVTGILEKVTENALRGRAERLWRETAAIFDDVPGVNDPLWIKDARHEVFVEAMSSASDPVALANDNSVSERTIYDWKHRPSFGMGVVGYFDRKRRALWKLEKRAWEAVGNPGPSDDVPATVLAAATVLRNVADPVKVKRAENEFEEALGEALEMPTGLVRFERIGISVPA